MFSRTEINKRAYRKMRAFVNEYKLTRGCQDCGYKVHPAALEFDHINDDKSFNIGESLRNVGKARLLLEMTKCEVVCANCHVIRTVARY